MTDLILFSLLLLCPFCIDHKKEFRQKMGTCLIAVFLILLFGLRHYTVGTDSGTYAFRYETLTELSVFEPGFVCLMKVLHALCAHYTFFFVVVACIIWGGLVHFYSKYTSLYWLAIFLFCALGGINTIANNCMRQGIAIIIFLNAISFALNKQWIQYFLLATVAFLFHRSAILIFPMYFLMQARFRWWLLVPSLVFFIGVLGFADSITNFLFSDYDRYLIEVDQVNKGKIVQLGLVSCFALVPLYSYYKTPKKDFQVKNMILWMITVYLICAWGAYIFNVGRALSRLAWYAFPIVWLSFAKYVEEKPSRFRFLILVAVIFLIFCYRLGVYQLSDTSAQADMIYYYKLFWQ